MSGVGYHHGICLGGPMDGKNVGSHGDRLPVLLPPKVSRPPAQTCYVWVPEAGWVYVDPEPCQPVKPTRSSRRALK